jgi:putative chitinase
MIDRRIFFSSIRRNLFSGRVGKRQVEGLNAILNRWEGGAGTTDTRQLAYILATAYHETARTLQPIKERGGPAYLRQNYDVGGNRPRLARANGNTQPGDGSRFAGRGFVQLTWRNNYRRVGQKIGIDLESAPQLALQLETAATILIRGMCEGWFTGRKLTHYFNATTEDWINARRIVNGIDRARIIGSYAKLFMSALQSMVDMPEGSNKKDNPAPVTPIPPVHPQRRRTRSKSRAARIRPSLQDNQAPRPELPKPTELPKPGRPQSVTLPYPQAPRIDSGGQ